MYILISAVFVLMRIFRLKQLLLSLFYSLGASWTWGSWVEYNQRFSSIIDASTPTQVINGSCPSHSIYQSFLVAKKKLQSESFSSTILIDINMDYSSRIFSYVIPGNF